jgi:hypothetical protein
VVALRTDPPRPTLAQGLTVWVITSFLSAAAVLFVLQRFFPEVKRRILNYAGLPDSTPNAVFILVLLVVGVAVQTAWWMIRRR